MTSEAWSAVVVFFLFPIQMKEQEKKKKLHLSPLFFFFFSLSLIFLPKKSKEKNDDQQLKRKKKPSLAHGGHGGASQPRPRHLPGVADGHERARQKGRDAAEDGEGRDREGLRRGTEGGRVRLFFCVCVCGTQGRSSRDERMNKKKIVSWGAYEEKQREKRKV